MNLIFALFLNTAVGIPATQKIPEVKTLEGAKTADCDGEDKKIEVVKTPEQKSAEEQALVNLGLKKDEPKTKPNPVVTTAPAMETCK